MPFKRHFIIHRVPKGRECMPCGTTQGSLRRWRGDREGGKSLNCGFHRGTVVRQSKRLRIQSSK